MKQFNDSYTIINNNININRERENLCNQDSSSLKEAVDIFQNTVRPLKSITEAEKIQAMVEEYGLTAFKEGMKIVKDKRPKAPLPYLESVLRNNKGSPQHNDPVAGAAAAERILERGELVDFNTE